jgi:hypothetical protein
MRRSNLRGADTLVRGRRPRRPAGIAPEFDSMGDSGSRGTRADQGVRPTMLFMPIGAGLRFIPTHKEPSL